MSTVSEFLPEQSTDDTDLGWGEWQEDDSDSFYLDDKPPHWA